MPRKEMRGRYRSVCIVQYNVIGYKETHNTGPDSFVNVNINYPFDYYITLINPSHTVIPVSN